MLIEANLDALVGPTHHFGGLGVGNVASHQHQHQVSHPKDAALEGLRKAHRVAALGVPQYLWLPPQRPRLDILAQLGFSGAPAHQLQEAYQSAPQILSAVFSSAFMWAANSATVTPGVDAADRKTHFTPANLISSWHRGCEAAEREADLLGMWQEQADFQVHRPLPGLSPLRDEGAANHMRLCDASGALGINVFVYGQSDADGVDFHNADFENYSPRFFPRQTREAFEAIARRHQLNPQHTFYLQQHPVAISAGVFHNDVIATSCQNVLLHHERAFWQAESELKAVEVAFKDRTGQPLLRVEVFESELPMEEAVSSYFFNSQIVVPGTEHAADSPRMVLICPQQCQETKSTLALIERILADRRLPIDDVHYVSLAESMANGGGPACLRLRVPLEPEVLARDLLPLRVDDRVLDQMSGLIETYYPESLQLSDFTDAEFVNQLMQSNLDFCRRALRKDKNA